MTYYLNMVWLYFIEELKPVHISVLFLFLMHGSKLSVTNECLDLPFKEQTHCY